MPDQATADTVLAQLTADPASYGAVAAQYPGAYTLPALDDRAPPDRSPAVLAEGSPTAEPNTAFITPVPEAGAWSSPSWRAPSTRPSRRCVPTSSRRRRARPTRPATTMVDDVRKDLGVTVNPRYGVLKDGKLVPGDGGVVDILSTTQAAAGRASDGRRRRQRPSARGD